MELVKRIFKFTTNFVIPIIVVITAVYFIFSFFVLKNTSTIQFLKEDMHAYIMDFEKYLAISGISKRLHLNLNQFYVQTANPPDISLLTGPAYTPADLASNDPLRHDAISQINQIRQAVGLPGVIEDNILNVWSQEHADYLMKNEIYYSPKRFITVNKKSISIENTEDPATPGYTKEGAAAGLASDIVMTYDQPQASYAAAVQTLLIPPQQRYTILNPDLAYVGLAKNTYYSVIDVLHGITYKNNYNNWPVVYPYNGEQNIPVQGIIQDIWSADCYDDSRFPSDVSTSASPARDTFVITLQFKPGTRNDIQIKRLIFKDATNNTVSAIYCYSNNDQYTYVGLYPNYPLKYNETYQVEATGSYQNILFDKIWKFTTEQEKKK